MKIEFIIAACLSGSAAIGFLLNRFVFSRIASNSIKAVALAISRAVFYAPSLVNVSHGVLLPFPLLLALENHLFHEFGVDLDVFVFLLPGIVFLGSLAVAWFKLRVTPNKAFNPDAQKRRAG